MKILLLGALLGPNAWGAVAPIKSGNSGAPLTLPIAANGPDITVIGKGQVLDMPVVRQDAVGLPDPEIIQTANATGVDLRMPVVVSAAPDAVPDQEPPRAQEPPVRDALASGAENVAQAAQADPSGLQSRGALEHLFTGAVRPEAPPEDYVYNAEGIAINERAREYFLGAENMAASLRARGADLSETMDVMDHTTAEIFGKLRAVEALAKKRQVAKANTYLEKTLFWIDAVLQDGDRKVAVHTHRVFFHRAPNPQSEIAEGIRRADGYLSEALYLFQPKGAAERAHGPLDEVDLVFDVAGYPEIKEHIRARQKEIAKEHGRRFRFFFLDELVKIPRTEDELRAQLNYQIRRYRGQDLSNIAEGVFYSRYVGLLLELNTLDHYLRMGWEVLQSGREVFDKDGMYVTELDVIVRNPKTGKVYLVEAKSARVSSLPFPKVLKSKILYKLDTYLAQRKLIEKRMGVPFDEVVFSVSTSSSERGQKLRRFLKSKEKELSEKYGFPVSFLFLDGSPKNLGLDVPDPAHDGL